MPNSLSIDPNLFTAALSASQPALFFVFLIYKRVIMKKIIFIGIIYLSTLVCNVFSYESSLSIDFGIPPTGFSAYGGSLEGPSYNATELWDNFHLTILATRESKKYESYHFGPGVTLIGHPINEIYEIEDTNISATVTGIVLGWTKKNWTIDITTGLGRSSIFAGDNIDPEYMSDWGLGLNLGIGYLIDLKKGFFIQPKYQSAFNAVNFSSGSVKKKSISIYSSMITIGIGKHFTLNRER